MDPLTLREYQRQAARTDRTKGDDLKSIMVPLLGLAGEAGSLLAEYKKWMREGESYKPFTDQVSEEIGDILWYLATIAERAGLDLEDVAHENLAKLGDRYGRGASTQRLLPGASRYDSAFPEHERLPTKIDAVFSEVITGGTCKIQTTINGQVLGDHLTDNSHSSDGYRYHDVFHLSYAILLGWSPILRRTLKLKRKSVPQIDEVEDGARAAITEEAIAAITFNNAKQHSFYDNGGSVDYELLKAIRLMTATIEVRDRSYREWEHAILESFKMWRNLVSHKRGRVIGDAQACTLMFEPIDVQV